MRNGRYAKLLLKLGISLTPNQSKLIVRCLIALSLLLVKYLETRV
ncbi:MAG: hypothetical protein ACOX6V_05330 [Patescibacteria group bacterium]